MLWGAGPAPHIEITTYLLSEKGEHERPFLRSSHEESTEISFPEAASVANIPVSAKHPGERQTSL